MAFSKDWDSTYKNKQHLSRWPWTEMVSRVFTYCPIQKKGFRILELGCGVGANIPLFLSLGADYHAIEGSPTAIADILTRFPQLKEKVVRGDFTREVPFQEKFDVVIDRAALTHNESADIKRALQLAHAALVPGGVYIGVDWYSSANDYAKRGRPVATDSSTRIDFEEGPYQGIGNMRFSTKEEMRSFFQNFNILELTHSTSNTMQSDSGPTLASWHIVGIK